MEYLKTTLDQAACGSIFRCDNRRYIKGIHLRGPSAAREVDCHPVTNGQYSVVVQGNLTTWFKATTEVEIEWD